MLHIKLSDRRPARPDDPMTRDWWGYDPTAPLDGLFARNRGRWHLGPRADREKYAAFSYTGDHKIKFIAEIEAIERIDERRAIVGHVLDPDHPLSHRWVDAPAPDSFRNPVTYFSEPDDATWTCACGCEERVPANRSFVPGHDQKAIHARITRQWGGTIAFIDWFDATYPEAGLDARRSAASSGSS